MNLGKCTCRWAGGLAMAIGVATAAMAQASPPSVSIELNKAEADQGACQFYFVVKSGDSAFDEFKLEFTVFGKDGAIARRLVADMGPLKSGRTAVKVFKTADACDGINGLLINDVKSCGAAQKTDDCVSWIKPSTRTAIKLFM